MGLHEQQVRYEEQLKTYELASSKKFPEELVLATVLTGMREPLRSQLQMRMGPGTKYSEIREWILQWESLNTPWGTSGGKAGGKDDGGQRPMEVDRIYGKDGKGKGKKGKDGKGKGKDAKGKDKGAKGKGKSTSDTGKGSQAKQWSSWNSGGWSSTWDPEGCRICGQRGHWKWECPLAKGKDGKSSPGKGKGKQKSEKVQQVEQVPGSAASTAGSTATSSTSLPPSASMYRGSAASVNMIAFALEEQERECPKITEVFDLTELDDDRGGTLGLEARDVMMIKEVPVGFGGIPLYSKKVSRNTANTLGILPTIKKGGHAVEVYAMDATDSDDDWELAPDILSEEPLRVNMVARAKEVEVIIDSGADVSVAPLDLGTYGKDVAALGVRMQDAQGKMIRERGCRVIDVILRTVAGAEVMVRERFAIAKISSVIMSLGRLLRWGWELTSHDRGPAIKKGDHKVPITLRRNTLTVPAMIAAVRAESFENPYASTGGAAKVQPLNTFDDLCTLPKQAEELVQRPGWGILPSGLPLLTIHKTEELNMEQSFLVARRLGLDCGLCPG